MRPFFAFCLLLGACATVPAREAAPTTPAPSTVSEPAYAWAAFDGSRLIESGASGLADRVRGRALTIDDPVRIASITKLVVALGVIRMVEGRRLDLDRDVSDYLGWQLRNPAYPDRPVTLRLLLSHRSSLRDGIDYAIPFGTPLREALADPGAYDAAHPPGAFFRYSNLNFPVIASVMERVSGERFDTLMERLVLDPLELDACFNWTTCSDAAIQRAVVLTAPDGRVLRDDLGGRRPDCPVLAPSGCDLTGYALGSNGALFSPQGGLRISVRDLVIIGRLLLNSGFHDGREFIRDENLQAMLGPIWRFDGTNGDTESGFYCAYGLAVQSLPVAQEGCNDDLFGGGRIMLGHAGDAYGVRSGLWIDPRNGFGIAYISIANGDDPPRGRSAFRAIEEALAAHLPRSGS
jgi:CubicO group peptidase (beta-lactamase class C family)